MYQRRNRDSETAAESEEMKKPQPSLPHERAFVLQLRGDADLEHGDFRGRIEHLASMHAAHFESIEELQLFIVRIAMQQKERCRKGSINNLLGHRTRTR